MVNFNQTKGQLSSIEHAMKSLQVDLEKAQFALEVKKGGVRCLSQHCEADGVCKTCCRQPSNFKFMSRGCISRRSDPLSPLIVRAVSAVMTWLGHLNLWPYMTV